MPDFAFVIGQPVAFKGGIKVYPPTVKDIIADDKVGIFYRILTFSEDDIRDEFKKNKQELETVPTAFEFLLANCYQDQNYRALTRLAFQKFCHMDAIFLYEEKRIALCEVIDVPEGEEPSLMFLEEEEFFNFQNAIREAYGNKPIKPPEPIDPNEDPRIRRIKEKARERDRIKEKKGAQGGIKLETCLMAICCMGIGITPMNIGDMSYAAVGPLMKMMQDKEKYDIDIRSLLAGADSKKVKPKYWMQNSEN